MDMLDTVDDDIFQIETDTDIVSIADNPFMVIADTAALFEMMNTVDNSIQNDSDASALLPNETDAPEASISANTFTIVVEDTAAVDVSPVTPIAANPFPVDENIEENDLHFDILFNSDEDDNIEDARTMLPERRNSPAPPPVHPPLLGTGQPTPFLRTLPGMAPPDETPESPSSMQLRRCLLCVLCFMTVVVLPA